MYKVIVIDDEMLVRRGIVMETDWQALNCVVVAEAGKGIEGLEAVRKYHPDLLICDIRMPKMDGIEMLKELRAEGNDVSVIFLTAYSEFSYAQSALKLLASDYLLKPLKDGELEGAVRKILSVVEVGTTQAEEEASMVIHLRSAKNAKNKYVEQSIRFIEAHYREDINISTVAADLEISEGYLSRVFKKETDYTFTNYLTLYRMKVATKLLSDCRVKVYEVADQVGYSDTAYFSAQFKKFLGVSPSEYQDRN